MEIGITYYLRDDVVLRDDAPDDALAEYDSMDTVEAIAAVLRRAGHEVRLLGDGRALVERLVARPLDLVFTFSAGSGGRTRETRTPGALELLGIPYTHSDPTTMGVAREKSLAKRVVASFGLATAPFALVRDLDDLAALAVPFPVLAKPATEGTSMGIVDGGRCDDAETLERHVRRILVDYRQPVLVEHFLTGPEFTVAILGTGARARVLGCSEIVPLQAPLDRFVYSSRTKRSATWDAEVALIHPPRRDPSFMAPILDLALAAYRALDCRDVGRVDIRLDGQGTPMFLELNAIPGLVPAWSDMAFIAASVGWTYDDLILAIVESARERMQR